MAKSRFAGMTVNERLFEGGVMDDFDRAARNRDRDQMILFLLRVELSEKQARETTDAILGNPKFYGY